MKNIDFPAPPCGVSGWARGPPCTYICRPTAARQSDDAIAVGPGAPLTQVQKYNIREGGLATGASQQYRGAGNRGLTAI